MAVIKAETAQGFNQLPALRQIGLMVGLAASVALGVAVVLWSQKPDYSLLFGSLSPEQASAVTEALGQAQIQYRYDGASGSVLVAGDQVHQARLKLAAQGLPDDNGTGFELLNKEQQLGTSQFVEHARYQHALETELARSIASLRNVSAARVHLAVPKRSVFIRRQEQPSASILLNVRGGSLDEGQVAAIVHLAASSVPNLNASGVTVVDQNGRLLTERLGDNEMAVSAAQFGYLRRLEKSYVQRIEDLLTPMLGLGKVRAQVSAELDFTQTEQTRESYDPQQTAVRSEQIVEQRNGLESAGGVPGSLSNEPPEGGELASDEQNAVSAENALVGNTSWRSTRNYELDKTISHTKRPVGDLQRLSVAVVVDDREIIDEDGDLVRNPLTEEELGQITALVREAVGFNAERGDTINVINSSFHRPQEVEPLPDPPLWEQTWLMNLLKQLGAGLVVVLLVFGVLKPTLRSLTEKGHAPAPRRAALPEGDEVAPDQLSLSGANPRTPQLPNLTQHEDKLNAAKSLASQDPGRVAQVVKNWVAADG